MSGDRNRGEEAIYDSIQLADQASSYGDNFRLISGYKDQVCRSKKPLL